jgi:hypothetical protein
MRHVDAGDAVNLSPMALAQAEIVSSWHADRVQRSFACSRFSEFGTAGSRR